MLVWQKLRRLTDMTAKAVIGKIKEVIARTRKISTADEWQGKFNSIPSEQENSDFKIGI